MKLKLFIYIFLILFAFKGKAQERVTTFGIQLKPIIPTEFFNAGKQVVDQNNIEYINMFTTSSFRHSPYFKKVFGNKCMCCQNILCNWLAPYMGFRNILDEIYDTVQKIRICKELIFCDKIVDKYFGHYLPIREFLF